MKPLAFNLRGAKKIAGDKNSSTFHLENGHKIMVAHAALPALQRKQVERLPIHLDEGGSANQDNAISTGTTTQPDVPETPAADPEQIVEEGKSDQPADQDKGVPVETVAPAAPAAPAMDRMAPVPAAAPPATGVDFQGAYNQGQKAISEAEEVAKQNATANIQTYQSDLDARKQFNDATQKNLADIMQHRQQVLNDYANGHIDPKHFQQSMSTGQKVSTAIGLLLGGLGAARNGGVNPALQWLQKQQENDIEAQKVNMDKQKTLLGANENMYKDAILGAQATRLNMNDILDHQIQVQAAKSGTLAAKAAADQAHANFALQNGQLLQSMAIRQGVLGALKTGGAGVQPVDLGRAGIMSPEEAQKEQGALNALKANIAVGNQTFNNLAKLQTAGYRLKNPVQAGSQIAVENAKLASIIQAANPSERLTPESAALEIHPYMLSLTDSPDTVQEKQAAFQQHLALKYAPQIPVTSQYAPASIPKYTPVNVGGIKDGTTATNHQTGQRIIYQGGRPVPHAR